MNNYPETDRKKALGLLGVQQMYKSLEERVRNCPGGARRRQMWNEGVRQIKGRLHR